MANEGAWLRKLENHLENKRALGGKEVLQNQRALAAVEGMQEDTQHVPQDALLRIGLGHHLKETGNKLALL